jgi:hypothetical protein
MAKKRKPKRKNLPQSTVSVGSLNKSIAKIHLNTSNDLQALFSPDVRANIGQLVLAEPDKHLAAYLLMARTMRTHASIVSAISKLDYHLAYMAIRAAGEEMLHLAFALHWPEDYLSRLRGQQQIFFYNLLRNFGQSDHYPPEQINQVLLSLYLKNKEELSGRAYTTNNRYLRSCIEHLDSIVEGKIKLSVAPKAQAVQKMLDALQNLQLVPAAINSPTYFELSEQIGPAGTELLGKGNSLRDVLEMLKGEVTGLILPTMADYQNLLHLYNLVVNTANSILHVSAFSLQADPTRSLLGQLTGQQELINAVSPKPLQDSQAESLHDLETIEQSLKMLTTVLTLYTRSLPDSNRVYLEDVPRAIFRANYVRHVDLIINDYLQLQGQTVMIRSR